MNIIYAADPELERNTAKIVTHPEERGEWSKIDKAIRDSERKLLVINAKNDRKIQVSLKSVAVIQSEDRFCNVRLITGESYLLNNRLKWVEETLDSSDFLKINNQTMINLSYIREFSASNHARIQVVLQDDSSYFVNRHYLKQFKERLEC